MSDDPRMDVAADWVFERGDQENAAAMLVNLDAVDPLRQPGILHIPKDGLRLAIAEVVQRQLEDDITARFGTIADADYFGDRVAANVEALLYALLVTS